MSFVCRGAGAARMTDLPVLRDLGIIIIAAALLVLLAARLHAPSIIAYIIAGLALGPVFALLAAADSVALIAETGIVLLLFIVGLELSLDKIRDVGRVALIAGLGQVVFTAAGGFGLSLLLGFEAVPALVIAVALTFSSTVVVVKLLTQKGELDSLYGRIAVGIFLVQDLVVIVALTLLTGIGDPAGLNASALLSGIGSAFGGMLLLLVIALFSARYVLPQAFRWMAPSPEGILIWSLAWCFLFVAAAELFHLSVEIGAFLAGLSLAQLPWSHDLRRRVRPLMNAFVMVFFVSLGIQMQLGAALEHWAAALALSLFVLIGNPLIFMWIIARMGYAPRTAFLTSVTVAQISEFSFVFAALGLASGLIDESILSLIGFVGLVTIGASVYMILYNHQLFAWLDTRGLLRLLRTTPSDDAKVEQPELKDHVIVVGMNALGRRIVRSLVAEGEEVIAIDTDPGKLEGLPCRTLLGNVDELSVLEDVSFRRARLLVSALQIENTNALLAYRGRSAGVATSIHAFDQGLVDELRDSGATHVLQSKNAGIRRLTSVLRELGLLRT
jgi:Kef-type K+ transport system membrane component KefB